MFNASISPRTIKVYQVILLTTKLCIYIPLVCILPIQELGTRQFQVAWIRDQYIESASFGSQVCSWRKL